MEAAAVEIALNASREEGILSGNPRNVKATATTLQVAENELTAWGAVFPDVADYPSPDTSVWLVEILGEGVKPGPPSVDHQEECLDIRVIVLEAKQEELVLMGRPSEAC